MASEKTPEDLGCATETVQSGVGETQLAQVVNLAITTTSRGFKKMIIAHDTFTLTTTTMYAPVEALAMIVDNGLRKDDYTAIQRGEKAGGVNIYVAYNVIAET